MRILKIAILSVIFVLPFMPVSGQQVDSATWQTVFEADLTRAELPLGWWGPDWVVRSGLWKADGRGLHKERQDEEGIILLRHPVVRGAVRVEYEAMSDTVQAGDLSLVLGANAASNHVIGVAVVFAFGSKGNTCSRMLVPGREPKVDTGALIESGKWHSVVVERSGGIIRAEVDGRLVLETADKDGALAGPYLGFYCWNSGTFRRIRVSTRPDAVLEALVGEYEKAFPTKAVVPWELKFPPTLNDHTIKLYVSPTGNDDWSGRSADRGSADGDGPWATPSRAMTAVRELVRASSWGGLSCPVDVILRGGVYELSSPLTFTASESGAKGNSNPNGLVASRPVTFKAYEGEKPVLSGGKAISGFTETNVNGCTAWVADLPDVRDGKWSFRQLWVNGERRLRPCLPKEGRYRMELPADFPVRTYVNFWQGGKDSFVCAEGNLLATWKNLQDVEVHVFNMWIHSFMKVKAVDPATRTVTLDRKSAVSFVDDPWDVTNGAQYRVENVFEALTDPGQWYLDRANGRLTYLPMPGEDIRTVQVFAPVLSEVVRLDGVREIRFDGVALSHTEWKEPDGWSGSTQAASETPGSIVFTNSQYCSINRCSVEHVGGYGIEVLSGCFGIELTENQITDLGAGGIKLWTGCNQNLVSDNVVADGGYMYHEGVGILVGRSGGNRVIHNLIHDFDYSGMSIGWSWGYGESGAWGNIVEFNRIYNIGRGMLSDMGGIYTLGVQPGTRVCNNVIYDVKSRTYGGWGIYTDEGSSFMTIENNLAYRCKTGGFHQHYGRENLLRNNIFALNDENELMRTREETHNSFMFERNIVLTQTGLIWKGDWATNSAVIRNNLYYKLGGGKPAFSEKTKEFAPWQKMGFDEGSIIADPKFKDPEEGDFTFKSDSAIRKIGFIPFDASAAGPRGK